MTHLDEATIQIFLDGEMPDAAIALASEHLAICEFCANALMRAEAEQAEVNLAFAAETNLPCPSQRIWARIENEIDVMAIPDRHSIKVETKSIWQQLGALLTPAQIGFASGLAAVVLVSFFAVQVLRQNSAVENKTVAENSPPQISNDDLANTIVFAPTPIIKDKSTVTKSPEKPLSATNVSLRAKSVEPNRTNPKSETRNPKSNLVLPEERGYLNSIAELSKAVETEDKLLMRPSFRVDYERNLAVTDEAISAMQKQVRQNPKDENAKRILFASYQNKIELLNTVTEKSQMIASLR